MTEAYHSALHREVGGLPAVAQVTFDDGSVAFKWDITHGWNAMHQSSDVLYTDLPWRDGYEEFVRRAKASNMLPYPALVRRVEELVRKSGKPAVLVTGKHALKYLQPDAVRDTTLNKAPAIAAIYHALPIRLIDGSSTEILKSLAQRYCMVGDFCCGYGRAGRIFAAAGKGFVMSDFNAECIGYIATHAREWWPK